MGEVVSLHDRNRKYNYLSGPQLLAIYTAQVYQGGVDHRIYVEMQWRLWVYERQRRVSE